MWSKWAESDSDKRQCTLFLCIFADGVPPIPPILIFSTTTGEIIITKESHLWDKRVHVEFTPTGWMNERNSLFHILKTTVRSLSMIVIRHTLLLKLFKPAVVTTEAVGRAWEE